MRDLFGHRPPNLSPWVRKLVSSTALGLLASAGYGTASAQTADTATDQNGAPIQEVVVTGSRIPVPTNVNATSPIQVITSQDVELTGKTDSIELLNMLPQNMINAAVDLGNNSNPLSTPGGVATVDLRGLGPQRTLVLVDGRRLGVGDPNTGNPNPAPDIDQIPAALIERVDVVTGGASAVYGSDAIAGVVNFIMKKNFEGIEVDGQYGEDMHHQQEGWTQQAEAANGFSVPKSSYMDGDKRDLSVLMGTNVADGAGNITGYFAYHEQDAVPGSHRDWSNCELVADDPGFDCIGSSNSNKYTLVGSLTQTPTGAVFAGPQAGQSTTRLTVLGTSLLPWPQAGSSPPAEFNSNAYEYLQRQDERYNAGFLAHMDINDYIKPYLDFSFMNDKTNVVVGPSAMFSGGNPVTADNNYLINCSNPLLSAQEAAALCTPSQIAADAASPGSVSADVDIGRRNVEGGGRAFYYEHTNYRVVGGIQGNFADAWSYDAYGQYYYTSLFNGNQNYLNYASINNALQVTGTATNPVCISGGSCVPYNIFTQGGVTAAQLNYLYTPGTAYGQNWEEIEHADVTGDLGKYGIKLPWAKDGLGINVGVEHRFEALNFAPDGAELAGDLAGASGASVAIDKGYEVKEAFTEVRAPIAQGLPGAYDLNVDVGYRYSDYSTAGRTNTYKFELQYAPTPDFRLRYSFDRAVRAPNLIELYNPQSYGQQSFVGIDPCAPTIDTSGVMHPATATFAQCAHTGVTSTEYGNGNIASTATNTAYTGTIRQCVSGQCGEVIGGNPDLQPETADTYSLGLTFTPTEVPGLTGTIDYFHILLKNEVGTIPGAYLFTQCLNNGADCGYIVRTAQGSLSGATVAGGGYILQTSVNTGASLFSGVDLQTTYKMQLAPGWGGLQFDLNGSYLQHTTTTPYVGAHTYDCAGLFGVNCGNTVNPRWRHVFRANWETPWSKLLLSATWRFIGKTGFDNNSNDPSLQYSEEGSYDVSNAHIPNYSYLDLTAVWPVTSHVEFRGGMNNVFDKDPPIIDDDVTGTGTPNTYPTYDELGRELFIAVKAKF